MPMGPGEVGRPEPDPLIVRCGFATFFPTAYPISASCSTDTILVWHTTTGPILPIIAGTSWTVYTMPGVTVEYGPAMRMVIIAATTCTEIKLFQ